MLLLSAPKSQRFLRFAIAIPLGTGNGVGKQGRGNQPPYRRYGPDTEIQYRPREPHGLAKTSKNSLHKGSRYGISVSTPHRRYGHRLRTPFLRTPFPRLLTLPIGNPRNRKRSPGQEKAMLHCDLRLRWKVASDLRFRAAISEPKTPSFCGISGDLAPSTRKSLVIAIARFWCAKCFSLRKGDSGGVFDPAASSRTPPGQRSHSISYVEDIVSKVGLFLWLGGSCLDACLCVCAVVWKLTGLRDRRKAGSTSFWGRRSSCLACCEFLRHRGRFPWWGGFRTPRYYGPLGCLLRECRAAHEPRHPLRCEVLRGLLGLCLSLC